MLKILLSLVLLLSPLFADATNAPSATPPSTNAPAATAPASIAIGDVVTEAQTEIARLQTLQAGLDPDVTLQAVSEELPKLSGQIDDRKAEDDRQQPGTASLNALQASQTAWQSLADSLASEQKLLSKRVQELDGDLWDLKQEDAKWKTTLDGAKTAKAPLEIITRINEVHTRIAEVMKAVQERQAPLYNMQNRVAEQDARTKSGLDALTKSLELARQQLFEQNRPPLWKPAALDHPATGVVVQEKATLEAQYDELTTYLDAKTGAVLVHLLILLLFIAGFFWIRSAIKSHTESEAALQDATHIFNVPFANALLLTLLVSEWLYPAAPRLLWAAVGATALIPAVIVTRRLIDAASFPILYASVIAFLVDQLRYVVTPAGILSRFLFLAELLAMSAFLLTALRFKHLSPSAPDQTRLKRLTRLYLHLAFFVFISAGFANVLGYIKLSFLIGDGMLESSYLAVVLYAAVRIVDALAISALSIRPLSSLGMVRRHRDLLYANATTGIRWLFFIVWFLEALQFFSQRDYLWQKGSAALSTEHQYFSIPFTLQGLLAFPITIWASFLISRFLRFALEEEVYPHMSLGRGIPYAASTMVHYAILLLGFFAAIAATGAELSQFAFLAGAFGVGLGFGLQNIMNNFVSGVILLFERPIKVGDTIQIDANTMGKVERIGIRASVILLTNGSEMIVPNGNLISNPVTNWTLSNCERLVEIPVTVTSKVDPQHVIDLMVKTAATHPSVLKNPAPHAILVTFGANLVFRLRAWIDSEEEWMKVTSDLSVAVNAALTKENITLG